MYYVTGLIALGTPCELDTCGIWNLPKAKYLDDTLWKHYDSDKSPFKDWGIEKNKFVPYHDVAPTHVANHVRAYVDLLYNQEFDILRGLFMEAINSAKARQDIFMLVYGKLRHLAEFKEINDFMSEEFASVWYAYIESVNKMSEHMCSIDESFRAINDKAKENYRQAEYIRKSGLYSNSLESFNNYKKVDRVSINKNMLKQPNNK